jgi:hypothetical protein
MADQGTAYIFNMCDQSITVTLNTADDPKDAAIDPIGQTPPFTPSSHSAPRSGNPAPYQTWELGGSLDESDNKLTWYLGSDVTETRQVQLSLTQEQLHLENDCQVFLFYDSAVLRWEGDSQTVVAAIGAS